MKKYDYVTASEVGEFIYCKRGWWLHKNGLLEINEKMMQGTKNHSKLASLLWWQKILLIIGIILFALGCIGIFAYIALNQLQ